MPKLLLADDDDELCEMLAEYLRDEGFDIDVAHDGEAALARAAGGDYDLMVLDVMMPKLNGFDVLRELRRSARLGEAMPFAVCYDGQLVGQLSIGNIVRRAFCSGFAGYWVDSRMAGRGIIPTALALAVDHAFAAGGLHRIEVNIRPENGPSRRVVEKLGFREEAYHPRYLHIDGSWRDHVGYAVTAEDVASEGGLLARWHRLSRPMV